MKETAFYFLLFFLTLPTFSLILSIQHFYFLDHVITLLSPSICSAALIEWAAQVTFAVKYVLCPLNRSVSVCVNHFIST